MQRKWECRGVYYNKMLALLTKAFRFITLNSQHKMLNACFARFLKAILIAKMSRFLEIKFRSWYSTFQESLHVIGKSNNTIAWKAIKFVVWHKWIQQKNISSHDVFLAYHIASDTTFYYRNIFRFAKVRTWIYAFCSFFAYYFNYCRRIFEFSSMLEILILCALPFMLLVEQEWLPNDTA